MKHYLVVDEQDQKIYIFSAPNDEKADEYAEQVHHGARIVLPVTDEDGHCVPIVESILSAAVLHNLKIAASKEMARLMRGSDAIN